MGALKVLNPALRPPIWSGSRLVPRGYALRLPGSAVPSRDRRRLGARSAGRSAISRNATTALIGSAAARPWPAIAAASGMSLPRLLAANGWNTATHAIARGEIVRIPDAGLRARKWPVRLPPPRRSRRTPAAAERAPGDAARRRRRAAAAAPTRARPAKSAAPRRGSRSRRGRPQSAALLPAGPPTGSADTTDYGVGPTTTRSSCRWARPSDISRIGAKSTARHAAPA